MPLVSEHFLDDEQYTEASIEAYESVYGRDFVSPGGDAMARELISRLELGAGDKVLDAGCGLGGSAFLLAREFGARVDAIDLSRNMIRQARRRCADHGLNELVSVEHGDCLALERRGCYHAVYSRDVFLHVDDKTRLFKVLHEALRPGGRLLFTDYCCGAEPWSPDFTRYVESRAYSLCTVSGYTDILATAGFVNVSGVDLTGRFGEILETELERISRAPIDEQLRTKLETAWRSKLERARSGDQRWGLFEARRPGIGQVPG